MRWLALSGALVWLGGLGACSVPDVVFTSDDAGTSGDGDSLDGGNDGGPTAPPPQAEGGDPRMPMDPSPDAKGGKHHGGS